MKFKPQSKEDIQSQEIWPDGTYPFEVVKAEEKLSKKGDPMLVLQLLVFNGDEKKTVFDYSNPGWSSMAATKFLHLCEALGLMEDYNAGDVDVVNFSNKEGWLELRTDQGSGDYGPSNRVVDYVDEPEDLADDEDDEDDDTIPV